MLSLTTFILRIAGVDGGYVEERRIDSRITPTNAIFTGGIPLWNRGRKASGMMESPNLLSCGTRPWSYNERGNVLLREVALLKRLVSQPPATGLVLPMSYSIRALAFMAPIWNPVGSRIPRI
jgi:hypothetical protein